VVAAGDPEGVERVAGGKTKRISKRQRRVVDLAVRGAEERTGLQFCIYLGPAQGDPREHAEALFVEARLHERPAVLLLVAPDRKRVEIVTAPAVRERIPDEACAAVIKEITPAFAQGRLVDGLLTGVDLLAEKAGPSKGGPGGADLPNIVGE
jgi:uncharacterized membrane protein YgcG